MKKELQDIFNRIGNDKNNKNNKNNSEIFEFIKSVKSNEWDEKFGGQFLTEKNDIDTKNENSQNKTT